MKSLKNFCLLAFVWTVYYIAKRAAGSSLTILDKIICGIVLLCCIAVFLLYLSLIHIYQHPAQWPFRPQLWFTGAAAQCRTVFEAGRVRADAGTDAGAACGFIG